MRLPGANVAPRPAEAVWKRTAPPTFDSARPGGWQRANSSSMEGRKSSWFCSALWWAAAALEAALEVAPALATLLFKLQSLNAVLHFYGAANSFDLAVQFFQFFKSLELGRYLRKRLPHFAIPACARGKRLPHFVMQACAHIRVCSFRAKGQRICLPAESEPGLERLAY